MWVRYGGVVKVRGAAVEEVSCGGLSQRTVDLVAHLSPALDSHWATQARSCARSAIDRPCPRCRCRSGSRLRGRPRGNGCHGSSNCRVVAHLHAHHLIKQLPHRKRERERVVSIHGRGRGRESHGRMVKSPQWIVGQRDHRLRITFPPIAAEDALPPPLHFSPPSPTLPTLDRASTRC